MKYLALAAPLALLSIGCSSSSSPATSPEADASTHLMDASAPVDSSPAGEAEAPSDAGVEAAPVDAAAILAARPYSVHVPASYDGGAPTPVMFMFHGYGASGSEEEAYLDLTPTSDAHGFLYVYANGTYDPTMSRFWNATNACCDLYGIPVDDVQYFDVILADLEAKYAVDPKRVYVMGHSNGGFMSHRLACDRASKIAAILSLEGAQWLDISKCNPSGPVPVVEIHGTADTTIYWDGGATGGGDSGEMGGVYPSALGTVADWAKLNGCTGAIEANGTTYDLVTTLPGNETAVQAYAGCPTGMDVQLWVVDGGVHVPSLGEPAFGEALWGWLSAHSKP